MLRCAGSTDGAEILHVVDLDGARAGSPRNLDIVERIAGRAGVPIQVGGGLRDEAAVAAVLEAGAARAVLGTRAQRDPAFVGELATRHGGERIVASVDGRDGRVAVEGWEQRTETPVAELVGELVGPRRAALRLHARRGRRDARRALASRAWPRSPPRVRPEGPS